MFVVVGIRDVVQMTSTSSPPCSEPLETNTKRTRGLHTFVFKSNKFGGSNAVKEHRRCREIMCSYQNNVFLKTKYFIVLMQTYPTLNFSIIHITLEVL